MVTKSFTTGRETDMPTPSSELIGRFRLSLIFSKDRKEKDKSQTKRRVHLKLREIQWGLKIQQRRRRQRRRQSRSRKKKKKKKKSGHPSMEFGRVIGGMMSYGRHLPFTGQNVFTLCPWRLLGRLGRGSLPFPC